VLLLVNLSVKNVDVIGIQLKPGVISARNARDVILKSTLTISYLWVDIIAINVKEVGKQSLIRMGVIVINVKKE
jgi:hypothetical protein